MSILPKNKMTTPVETPSNFFIYGASMHGKSFLAGEFPSPLFLDTDGNSDANPYPSIHLRNVRGKNGKLTANVVEQLDDIVTALQTETHDYETIILDVIDDIVVMIEQYICDREGVESLGDVGYGKGYAIFNNIFQQLVIELKGLPLNVVYVSRLSSYEDANKVVVEEPSLKEKHVNIVNGNCDYRIQCKKVGKNYLRISRLKRKNYTKEAIGDKRILAILETVTGAFERSQRINKQAQDKIVQNMEKETERQLTESSNAKEELKKSEQPTTERKAPQPTPTRQKPQL